jgi:hypothetical protein
MVLEAPILGVGLFDFTFCGASLLNLTCQKVDMIVEGTKRVNDYNMFYLYPIKHIMNEMFGMKG